MTVLRWFDAGATKGPTVAYFHGTEASEHQIPFPEVAQDLGIRVLMALRPGYGASPAMPNASLRDVARVVIEDLAAFDVNEFWVMGWSGGGPYALACAVEAPRRVAGVGLFSSWAPMNPPDAGLPMSVKFAMFVAARSPRPAVRALFVGRGAPDGMIDDVRRVARPWEFSPRDVVTEHRVVVWHARDDDQVPVRPWRKFDSVELRLRDGTEHAIAIEDWREALNLVAGTSRS